MAPAPPPPPPLLLLLLLLPRSSTPHAPPRPSAVLNEKKMASPLEQLLGATLTAADGSTVAVKELGERNRVVGAYMSASWCGPCRAFTPQLAKAYKAALKDKGMEIVFVSSDRDEGSFASYRKEMPWLALPFAARDIKNNLSKKFKVQGIPTLILLDAKTGEVITKNGREAVSMDPTGEKFPWIPKPLSEIVGSARLLKNGSGDATTLLKDCKAEVVALYFSASWCGPCRAFSPVLAKIYEKMRAEDVAAGRGANPRFEVVLVSADENDAAAKAYFKHHPWTMLDFAQEDVNQSLNEYFEVRGIPTVILIDHANGDKVISTEARGAITNDPEGFPWKPKPVEILSESNGSILGDGPSVVVFVDTVAMAKDVQAKLTPAIESLKKANAEAAEFTVAVAPPHRLSDKLKEIAKTKDCAVMAFDLDDGRVAKATGMAKAADVTPDAVVAFLQGVVGGSVAWASLQ